MAKKKASSIVIKDEELMPTTIGVYSNKTKSPIVLFLIIMLFLGIAFFLPNIQEYVNKLTGKSDETNQSLNNHVDQNQVVNPDNNVPDSNSVNSERYTFDGSNIENDSYIISGITKNNTLLTLTITAKDDINLDSYYIELSDVSNTLLERVKLGSVTLNKDASSTFNYTINTDAASFTISKKSVEDYPNVNLNYDENSVAVLSCENSEIGEIKYTFVDDQLTTILYTFNASSTAENYTELLNRYSIMNNSYKLYSGVNTSLITSENGFNYSINLDLSAISTDNLNNIDLKGIYGLKTLAKEVKFKSEAQGFTCSI